jgi:RNA-directed DNA polymerase
MEERGMSSMNGNPSDQPNVAWEQLPWKKLEVTVYHMQKRIFQASKRGDTKTVHKIQKLLMKSEAARLLAVRRVTQDNQGKKTAGVDGVKSVPPVERLKMVEAIHPKQMENRKPKPLRRVWIPRPAKEEKRPLGIPVMVDRACQALAKQALEPQWEAQFERNSYGFQPGRSCHDAIEAIYSSIKHKDKYVLDADIAGCFDNICHEALLCKLNTHPRMRRLIKGWLKAGVFDNFQFAPTEAGTPQGGVISPLLANIALHGLEEVIVTAYRDKDEPQVIRYADDFVILHPTEEGIQKAQTIATSWLKNIGLELKPSKTKVSHTLKIHQGNVGFDFVGFTIRQFPVGRTHTGKNSYGKPLGYKTIIKPSKKAIKEHMTKIGEKIRELRAAPQETLIRDLNPIIRGWTNYYRTVVSKRVFSTCDTLLYNKLRRWAKRRHANKNMAWIVRRYWLLNQGKGWTFGTEKMSLWKYSHTTIQRHIKVRGTASLYDGNLIYWAQRVKNHPMTHNTLGKLLKSDKGRCRYCGLYFKDGDLIEVDHILPLSLGGRETFANLQALHRHCHDQRHAELRAKGIHDKDHMVEEPCAEKSASTVLKTSKRGDSLA